MQKRAPITPITAGFLFALASSALFAIRPIFVKLVYAEGVDPTTLIALRMLFSAPIYAALLWYFLRKPERRAPLSARVIVQIGGCGLLGYYSASLLDLLGLQYVTAQLGRMLLYTYPTFVVLLGAILFSERISGRTVAALLFTYLGVAVIFGHDLDAFGPDVITGALFITASAVSFAFYLLFGRSLITRVGSRVFTCIALLSASVGIFIHFAITHSIADSHMTAPAFWLILLIAIFCTVIPTFFTAAAVSRIGADRTGIVAMVGPGFTSVFAVAMLGEAFTVYHLLGIALTVGGVSLLNRR
ncbi:MAG: DMT family transporter [Gammaproteobacteria bacterium]|nr:DMT family transporter [Gammaproteobacteria bacterium]